jgi:maltose alpha-D-glucosyltransferase/alpha-amylase
MQWSADRNAGFSTVPSAALYHPVIADPPYGYQTVNVEAQETTVTSLLQWIRAIVKLRRRYHAFGRGTFEPLAPENRRVLAFLRRWQDEVILCVNNLSRHAQYAELDLGEFDGWSPMELWSGHAFPKITDRPYLLTMNGRDFLWFRLMPPGGPERLGAIAPVGA